MDAASCPGRCTALSPRAVHRLQIAAALMHGARRDAEPVEKVLAAINALPPERREHLRSLVDWVEAYEIAEAAGVKPELLHRRCA